MSKLAAKLLEESGGLESLNRNSAIAKHFRARGVYASAEFRRVRDLPRRILLGLEDGAEADAFAEAVGDLLWWYAGGEGPTPLPLRPMQAAMLVDCAEHGGMTVSLSVGSGKSWAAALMAVAPGTVPARLRELCGGGWPQVECERPVLLLPPGAMAEMENDVLPLLSKTYKLHPNLKLLSYSRLQVAKHADVLTRLQPDFLICDEIHSLKNLNSARGRRVKHWMKTHPETVFAGMTATLSDRSLRDFHHIVLWSHPLDPPLPRGWKELEDWANAVDADVPVMESLPPGALVELCAPGETPREGLQRRLAETSGFILAREASCSVPLTVRARRDVVLPKAVLEAIDTLNESWVTPDGLPVPDASRWAARSRELALGFYYVWDWGRITPDGKPDMEWLEARNDWAVMVREVCRRGLPDFDSELRVRNGVKAGALPKSLQSAAAGAWEKWDGQRHKPKPPTVPVWLTDTVMQWVVCWMNQQENTAGVIWYEHQAVGEWFMREFKAQVFEAGMNEQIRTLARSARAGTFPIVCSRQAHYQIKNLQAWSRNLILTPSPSGKVWEQQVGRTHRSGQKAARVEVEFLAHTDVSYRSMTAAVRRARYTLEVLQAPQKLLTCDVDGWSRDENAQPDDKNDALGEIEVYNDGAFW